MRTQALEESGVLAVVDGVDEVAHPAELGVADDGQHLGRVGDLLLEVDAVDGHGGHEDSVKDEVVVCAEFVGSEGGEALEEEGGRLREFADGRVVEGLVDLEPVPPVPVTALLDHAVCGTTRHDRVRRA